jgi:hypothetical protein
MPTTFRRVELAIAAIIVAVVASRVTPDASKAEQEQADGVLKARLASVQSRIDRHRHDRGGRDPDFATKGWGTLTDPSSLIGGGYLLAAPINPAFPGFDKTSIVEVHDPVARGSPAAAWVWNVPNAALYASGFDEATGRSTGRPAD